jgi:hypothetical protein
MPRRNDRGDRRDDKQDHKLDRSASKVLILDAKSRKKLAAAKARKWLCILLGLGIAIYFILSKGGGMAMITKLRGLLPF